VEKQVLTRTLAIAMLMHCSIQHVAADPLQFYVWCGPSVTGSEYPGFDELKMDDGRLYIFAQGKGYGDGEHTYAATLYDAIGTVLHQQTAKFDGEDEPWDTWTRYDYDPDIAVPGRWFVDVYLDGRPLTSKHITVRAPSRDETARHRGEMTWAVSNMIQPVYPDRALRTETPGLVSLNLRVQSDGTVRNVHTIGSHPEDVFDEAVKQAATQWEFEPLSNNDDRKPQHLYAVLNFNGKKVSVEISADEPPRREYPYRFLGKSGSQIAVQRLQRFGYKMGQLVNLTSAAYFPDLEMAKAACKDLIDIATKAHTGRNKENRPICFIRNIVEVDSEAIGDFRTAAETRFHEMGGEPYGLWAQAD